MIAGLPKVLTNAFCAFDLEAFSIFRSPPANGRTSRGTNTGTREVFHEQSRIFSSDYIELHAIHLHLDHANIHSLIFGA